MTLALIAGAGALPGLIAARQPERPYVASLSGFAPDGLTSDLTFRIEHLGSALQTLKAEGITRLCLIGKVSRPAVDPAQIDDLTKPLVPRMMAAMAEGDDGALRGLMAILEEAGFALVGAHEIAADLLPPEGLLVGALGPTSEADAARAEGIVEAMGAADIGQACIVAGGQALAIEALPGTDHMIGTLLLADAGQGASGLGDPIGMAADWLTGNEAESVPARKRNPVLPKGGLLYKAPKPGQELRADMPTIGPTTVRLAAEAGLDGIVIAAGGVLLAEEAQCRDIASAHGLFLWVRPRGAA
ncbi:MAG: UDP-2,3-diacylglucosamine diphosphatase LpxI [Pseudomonadota bacterium]